MKIPGKIDSLGNEAVRISLSGQRPAAQAKDGREQGAIAGQQVQDQVHFGVARAIQSQLDPQQMAEQREARKLELKRLIHEGNYQMPSSEELAGRVEEEITMEILTAGKM